MKIMIIEDDPVIATSLKKELEKWNYQTENIQNFHQIMETFHEYDPHLVLIDINLPAFNGYHWCQEIRKVSKLPIIFISSRSDKMDLIMAIQMGGDDFIQKPFDLSIVVAKIQALLRRSYDFVSLEEKYYYNQVTLLPESARLVYQENSVDLTHTELQILIVLFKNKEKYSSREELMDACWRGDNYIDDNTLAVNISRLRKKLDNINLTNFIETKKNIGYRLKGTEHV